MVTNDESTRLFLSTVGNEPSRTLRNEVAEDDDKAGTKNLKPKRQAPLDIALQM
jgi:hypothetical protein